MYLHNFSLMLNDKKSRWGGGGVKSTTETVLYRERTNEKHSHRVNIRVHSNIQNVVNECYDNKRQTKWKKKNKRHRTFKGVKGLKNTILNLRSNWRTLMHDNVLVLFF
jgi:hypothetical protein